MKRRQVKRLVIKRSGWGRNSLLNPIGQKMCCLGFLGRACGIDRHALSDVAMPSDLIGDFGDFYPEAFRPFVEETLAIVRDSSLALEASKINDAHETDIPIDMKEQTLIELFKLVGIRLEFR